MTAGESADEVARRSAEAADRLEKSAQRARRRSEAFAAGAEGERLLAESLGGLAARGWFILPDRRTASGGNIDIVLIGPPGVFILDAKHWSGVVSRVGLSVGRFNRSASASALGGIAADVRASLGHDRAQVTSALVLTHTANRGHSVRAHEGILILSVDQLEGYLTTLPTVLTGPDVETVTGSLMTLLPPVGTAPPTKPTDSEEVPGAKSSTRAALYRRFNVYYYLQPWSKAGRRRLYLKDEGGETLAYKDLATGVVAVTDDTVDEHVRQLLENASAASVGLTKATVPKIAVDVPGGRLLSSLTRTWRTFHIGHRWRKGALDRLYCIRADPREGVDELGFVDLTDGTLHPVHDKPLGPDLAAPRRYLELHRDRYKPKA